MPVLPSKRPEWILEKHAGELPALEYRNEITVAGPFQIAEFIEKTYPLTPLTREGVYTYQEILEKTKEFYPALTAYILNKDSTLDPPLREAVHRQLDLMDEILRTAPGRFFCGIEMTLADLYLTPRLFHVSTLGFERIVQHY